MPHRVADELIRRLAEAGVERIYGVVGDSLNPVTDALRLNDKVKWIQRPLRRSSQQRSGAGHRIAHSQQ
jgi:pyruvate dehydrogenase (quinone)